MARSDARDEREWWRHALIYQIYPRSFADANGDGVGDLAGVRSRLGYLRDLGVDAIWFTPWYVSPLADGGYDVADYRDIDPLFGTLAEAERLIAEALDARDPHDHRHRPQPRVGPAPVVRRGADGGPDSPLRDRFWFRPGKGADGSEPPNGWRSALRRLGVDPHQEPRRVARRLVPAPVRAGPARPQLGPPRRTGRARGHPPLLVRPRRRRRAHRLGGAGAQAPDLPELPDPIVAGSHPFADRDELHELYREWRRIADDYDPPRALIGELWLEDRDRFALYLRPDELHGAFNFDFLAAPWDVDALRACIDDTLGHATRRWAPRRRGSSPTTTSPARSPATAARTPRSRSTAKRIGTPTDPALGERRARAAVAAHRRPARLVLRVPGRRARPARGRGPTRRPHPGPDALPVGRRRPRPRRLPGAAAVVGRHATVRVQPAVRDRRAVAAPARSTGRRSPPSARRADPASMLSLYRTTIAVRRERLGGDAPLTWLPSAPDVLMFRRGDIVCLVNLGDTGVGVVDGEILVASAPVIDGCLPPDGAVWIATARDDAEHRSTSGPPPTRPPPRPPRHRPFRPPTTSTSEGEPPYDQRPHPPSGAVAGRSPPGSPRPRPSGPPDSAPPTPRPTPEPRR